MGIDFVKTGISVGVGGLDEVTEWWDEKTGRTESFRNAKDITRLVAAGLGYAMQIFWPKQARLGESLALSATPLLVKSIAKPIRAAMTSSQAGRTFVPRRRAPAPPLPGIHAAGSETVITKRGEEVIMSVT